jgi:hypothetical protein
MADENVYPNHPPVHEGERVGFCQDCGKPLTASTIRTVGSGVFCEPCLERRLTGAPVPGSQYTNPTYGAGPGTNYASGYPPPPNTGGPGAPPPPYSGRGYGPPYPPPDGVFPPLDGSTPHPLLAGFLGFIPGVGAMYNGQFGKGIVHLIVFVVLVSLSDNVNGVFGLLVAGWVFYMAFEAYHTAKARRDGLPLPDPFGLNNIGERWGLKNWNPGDPTRGSRSQAPGSPDWVGYVPPSNFATTPPPPPPAVNAAVPPVQDIPVPPPPPAADYAQTYAEDLSASIRDQAVRDAGYVNTPPVYSQTYTGVPPVTGVNGAPIPPVPVRRFPVGAIWLIALGLIFLMGNIDSHFRLSGRWITPLVLAALAAWIFVRRMGWAGGSSYITRNQSLACILRGPVLLMTLAVMFTLQGAHWLTIGQTWPIFIIALGGMLLLERAAGRSASYVPTPPVNAPVSSIDPISVMPNRWTPAGDATVKGGQ